MNIKTKYYEELTEDELSRFSDNSSNSYGFEVPHDYYYDRNDFQNQNNFKRFNLKKKGVKKKMAKKGYSMQDRLKYHSMRARENSVDPKTGESYSDVDRARSRGYLQANKNNAICYKLKNGLPIDKKKGVEKRF